MLGRPSNFDDVYKKSTFKRFLVNSALIITDTNQNTLLSMTEIERVDTHLNNSFLPTIYPTEETTIKIIGWDKIDSARKTYLTTRNNFIYIRYQVDGITTTGCRVCVIDNWQINYRQNRATIKCVGILNRFNATTKSNLPQYWGGDGRYQPLDILKDICGVVGTTINVGTDYPHLSIWSSVGCEYPFSANELGFTKAEALQNLYIALGGGARVNFDYTTNEYNANIWSINHIENTELCIDNIYDDLEILEERPLPTNVSFHGYTKQSVELIHSHNIITTQGTFTEYATIADKLNEGYVVSHAQVYMGGSLYNASSISYFLGALKCDFNISNYGTGELRVYGYKLNDPNYKQVNNEISLTSCLLEDTQSTSATNYVINNAKKYISYNKVITFSCRVNPALEPLDYVWIDNEIGNIFIEDITISFTGSFKGTIKGKVVGLFDPIVSNYSYTYIDSDIGYRAKFDIKNDNGKDFALKFYADNTQFDPFNPTNVPANSTLTYYEDERGSASDFYYYAKDKNDGTLTHNIYVVFKYGDGRESEKVEIIHRDMVEYDPECSEKTIVMPNYSFIIGNPNNEALTLHIESSGGTQDFDIGAGQQIEITQQNCPMLDDSISAWLNNDLQDDIHCWFEASDGAISNNTILVEANA